MSSDVLTEFFSNTLHLYLDAAPWLLVGLVAAGLIKAWVPEQAVSRWLGGPGFGSILKAALVGAPLPLCSCSAVPAALALRRAGASPGATVSFLVATPETGADSVAVTYALMGPFMAVVRPVAAVVSAVTAGFLASRVKTPASRDSAEIPPFSCSGGACCAPTDQVPTANPLRQTLGGLRYAFTDLLGDIGLWMAAGLVVAGALVTVLPPDALTAWGQGPLAYLAMLVVGIPMFICATASTPLAAALLLTGVSPGAVLVFLLAGPATNAGTIALLRRELGNLLVIAYVGGIMLASVAAGLVTDLAVDLFAIDMGAELAIVREEEPGGAAWSSALLLAALTLMPLARKLTSIPRRRSC